jgi:hypothetical protein
MGYGEVWWSEARPPWMSRVCSPSPGDVCLSKLFAGIFQLPRYQPPITNSNSIVFSSTACITSSTRPSKSLSCNPLSTLNPLQTAPAIQQNPYQEHRPSVLSSPLLQRLPTHHPHQHPLFPSSGSYPLYSSLRLLQLHCHSVTLPQRQATVPVHGCSEELQKGRAVETMRSGKRLSLCLSIFGRARGSCGRGCGMVRELSDECGLQCGLLRR